jgi:nucleosome assembly protein 1-like 1
MISGKDVGVDIAKTKKNAPTPVNTPSANDTLASFKQISEKIDSPLLKNPYLLEALQGRLGKLVGQSSGYIDSLPQSVKEKIEACEELSTKHSELFLEYQKELQALDKKYLALNQPLYDKRFEIINGLDKDEEGEVGIPEFWLTCLKNCALTESLICDQDFEALTHLIDIRTSFIDGGFKLDFHFSPNEYFEDSILSKSYFVQISEDNEVVFDHAEGTQITWIKDLTVKVESRKQRHKSTNKTRVIKKLVPAESFFNFFSPLSPEENDNEDEDFDEKIQADYEIGEFIQQSLIPRAIDWFTGKAVEYDEEEEEYEEGDEEEEEDDSENGGKDNGDEDSSDGEEQTQNSRDKAPECKQQ